MLIPVLIEPAYQGTIWAQQTLDGLTAEASRRKYDLRLLNGERYRDEDYGALFGRGRRIAVIMGTSITWVPEVTRFLADIGTAAILISFEPVENFAPHAMVRMDYAGAMHAMLSYLDGCGRGRIALYGVNPNSSADTIKLRYFQFWCTHRGTDCDAAVFYNMASLADCCDRFMACHERFNAAICTNDIAAVALMRRLKARGLTVPNDLYIASFGNTLLAQKVTPGITSAVLDHYEMGCQAVHLFSYMHKQKTLCSISVRVPSRLLVRESTALSPVPTVAPLLGVDPAAAVNFYNDAEVQRLSLVEQLLRRADAIDLALMRALLAGETYEALEQRLFLSGNALKYRKKRLMSLAQCQTGAQFQAFLADCQALGMLAAPEDHPFG